MGSNTLLVTSGQALMNSMLNGHEQPAVLSAVMKQQMTMRMRQNINDGMDVCEFGIRCCQRSRRLTVCCCFAAVVAVLYLLLWMCRRSRVVISYPQ